LSGGEPVSLTVSGVTSSQSSDHCHWVLGEQKESLFIIVVIINIVCFFEHNAASLA